MKKSEITKIREILRTENNVEFTVKGITEYGKKKDGSYGQVSKVFIGRQGYNKDWNDSISTTFYSMNVTKWGPTCVTLYTYDMLNKKSIGKIRYEDVRFIVSEQFECEVVYENPLKKIPGFVGTEKG